MAKMISTYNNIIVMKVFQNDNIIIGNIANYKSVFKRTSVGEFLTTTEPFEYQFPGPSSSDVKYSWILYFYPKGQWTYGHTNHRARFYLKVVPCESDKTQTMLTVDVQFRIYESNLSGNACTPKTTSHFIINDISRHWAGPYEVSSEINNENIDNLIFRCDFGYASPEMLFHDTAAYNKPAAIKRKSESSIDKRAKIMCNYFLGLHPMESHGISLHQNMDTISDNHGGYDAKDDADKNLVAQGNIIEEPSMDGKINYWNNHFRANASRQNMGNEKIPVGGIAEISNSDNDLVAQEDIVTDKQPLVAFWSSRTNMDIDQVCDTVHEMKIPETKMDQEDVGDNQTFDEKMDCSNRLFDKPF